MDADASVVATAAQRTLAVPDARPIAILAEDNAILAVAKPAGLVVHPAYRHPDGTLTDVVFTDAERRGLPRPWLLHRIDRETSGVVLFARSDQARQMLARQFQQRHIGKRYLAIVKGELPASHGEIEAPLCRDPSDRRRVIVAPAGKPACTRFQVVAAQGDFSFVLAEPLTGRTHQIRAHLAHVGAPIVGDVTYGGALGVTSMTEAASEVLIQRAQLHAWELAFRHPLANNLYTVRAPVPDDMRAALVALGLGGGLAALPGLSWAPHAVSR